MNTARFATFAIAAAAGAAITANAGVKYWDKPGFRDYDVGDYVQDGLRVNYDGIRNQGPNADHDSSAMTWVNCAATGSTYDMTRYSTNGTAVITGTGNANATKAWNNDAAHGSWTDNGFVFNRDACFHQPSSFAIPTTYTIQSLVEAKPNDLNSGIGYVMCPYDASGWAQCSYGMRNSGFDYGGGSVNNTFYLVSGSIGKRPAVRGAGSIRFSYMTAIQNVNDGVIFSETEAPWSASYSDTSYGHAYDSSKSGTAYNYSRGFCIGGHYPRTDEMFKGTIKNFRFYNRCLSDAEVLWNRVVDEARYFGRGREITVIPVTNVIESCPIAGVRDYHYAIDAEGQTFTAPAQRTVNGKRHVLSGYTLETWNGLTWGASVDHDGESSYTATDTNALVRITWQYTPASGEGSLKTYDVGDYVEGAAIHFDGIRNAGASAEHDPDATTWANLGSAGVAVDLSRTKYGYGDLGGWDGDGYWFTDTTKFASPSGATNWPVTYTVQALIDADIANQQRKDTANYVYSVSWNRLAMGIYPTRKDIELQTQKESKQPYGPYLGGTSFQYVNGFVDANAMTSAIFSSTLIPTSGSNVKGYETMDSAVGSSGIIVGGSGHASDQALVGKIKSLRFYFDKVLTEEELEQNRKVDNYRFFGIVPVTNVIVQSTYSYLEGYDKCGPYEVDGSYTFVAPATNTAPNGITYACDGYTVETWDGSKWTGATAGTGNSYSYNTSAGTVRLTWRWKATSGLRSAANYRFEDYAAGGLKVHLDGIFNAGVEKPRTTANTTNTKWVNLGSNGADSDGMLAKGNDSSDWTSDGYYFDGKTKFTIDNFGVKPSSSYTIQLLSDVDRSLLRLNSEGKAQHNYLFSGSYNKLAVSVYGQGKPYLRAAVDINFSLAEGEHLTYFTGMMDQSGASPVAYAFPGPTPASGTTSTDSKLETPTVNKPNLGGWGGTTAAQLTQFLIGTIKSFRYYDRVLTEEELIRNRQVDSARYFSALAVTNVLVAVDADSTGITPAETADTAYFVEGSHTFTVTNPPAGIGYRLSVPDGNGGWTVSQSFTEGGSYTYDSENSPATVKLEWRVQKPFVIVIR